MCYCILEHKFKHWEAGPTRCAEVQISKLFEDAKTLCDRRLYKSSADIYGKIQHIISEKTNHEDYEEIQELHARYITKSLCVTGSVYCN